jgi:hypothetical protein
MRGTCGFVFPFFVMCALEIFLSVLFLVAVRHHCEEREGGSRLPIWISSWFRGRPPDPEKSITAFCSSADSPCLRLASSPRFPSRDEIWPAVLGGQLRSVRSLKQFRGIRSIFGFRQPSTERMHLRRSGCSAVSQAACERILRGSSWSAVLLQGVRECLVCLRVVGS